MPWIALGIVVVTFGGMFCVFAWTARRERRRQADEARLALAEFGRYDTDGMQASAAALEPEPAPAEAPAPSEPGVPAAR
jgi:hypothetical protein